VLISGTAGYIQRQEQEQEQERQSGTSSGEPGHVLGDFPPTPRARFTGLAKSCSVCLRRGRSVWYVTTVARIRTAREKQRCRRLEEQQGGGTLDGTALWAGPRPYRPRFKRHGACA
jgi:hypothetical protein